MREPQQPEIAGGSRKISSQWELSHAVELRREEYRDPSPPPHEAPKGCIQVCPTQDFWGQSVRVRGEAAAKKDPDRGLS